MTCEHPTTEPPAFWERVLKHHNIDMAFQSVTYLTSGVQLVLLLPEGLLLYQCTDDGYGMVMEDLPFRDL